MARKKTNLQKYILIVLLVITALFASLVYIYVQQNHPASEAAKGSGSDKGGKPKPSAYTGTCSVTPNPAHVQSTTSITGSGFRPSVGLGITTSGAGGTQFGFVYSDASGNFSKVGSATWPGTETISVQDDSLGAATCTFQVI